MFILDLVATPILDEILDWFYQLIIGFFADFFSIMGNMGVDLFDIPFVKATQNFFSYLAWSLFVTGIVVAIFETAIDYQSGRGNIKDTSIHIIKGFMATSLFTIVPVELYKLSVTLQNSLTWELSGIHKSFGELGNEILGNFTIENIVDSMSFGGIELVLSPIFMLFFIIMLGYSIVKVFFANLKRGGILLIQIAVGSLYMFSVPRGYLDGFTSWCKQIIALCLTAFLQVTILTLGLLVCTDDVLLGLGLMLSATEIPRIAGAFGLDTSTKANVTGAVHTASMAVSTTKNVVQLVAK